MSIVIFIPVGVEYTDKIPGGIVNTIGNDEPEELTVKKDNHQRTFLVKNDDGSLDIFNLVKRTTADLVLPDNRMAITFVDYHKHFDMIPLKEIGLEVIIGNGLSIKDSIINLMNVIKSLQRGRSYLYTVLDKDYNRVTTKNNKIEISKNAVFNNIGKYLLSQVRREETDIEDIEKGYVTITNPSQISGDWVKSAVQNGINISNEDEVPLQILTQQNKETDQSNHSVSPPPETTEPSPITPGSPRDTAISPQESIDTPEEV